MTSLPLPTDPTPQGEDADDVLAGRPGPGLRMATSDISDEELDMRRHVSLGPVQTLTLTRGDSFSSPPTSTDGSFLSSAEQSPATSITNTTGTRLVIPPEIEIRVPTASEYVEHRREFMYLTF